MYLALTVYNMSQLKRGVLKTKVDRLQFDQSFCHSNTIYSLLFMNNPFCKLMSGKCDVGFSSIIFFKNKNKTDLFVVRTRQLDGKAFLLFA